MYSVIRDELTQWADALFASALQRSEEPSATQVRQAIAGAIGRYGGAGCAARIAQAYGDDPQSAALRMRWALSAVASVLGGSQPALASGTGRSAGPCASRAA